MVDKAPPFFDAPLGVGDSRFECHMFDHNSKYLASAPYNQAQGETFLNKPHQMRLVIPYRGFSQVNQDNLYPGLTEIGLYDSEESKYLFEGPVWTAVASSDQGGTVNVSAQSALSYLAKHRIDSARTFTAETPAHCIDDLITYANARYTTAGVPFQMLSTIVTDNASTITQQIKAIDRVMVLDAITSLLDAADGTDIYDRFDGFNHQLSINGGRLINPIKGAWEYGGVLNQHSLQVDAQTISNDYLLIGSNAVSAQQSDLVSQATYDMLYQEVDRGSDLTKSASLIAAVAQLLPTLTNPTQLPTLVVNQLFPQTDFDLGDQFQVVIDDWWAQYSAPARIVGWQWTVSGQDKMTTNIYVNDASEV